MAGTSEGAAVRAGAAAARAKRRATSRPPRMPASASRPGVPDRPIRSAGVSSASSMALRNASTASVRPLIEITRLKNSASPSWVPSRSASSVRIGPRMTTEQSPASSFPVTATLARSPSGTTTKEKPRSTGSMKKRSRPNAPSRSNRPGLRRASARSERVSAGPSGSPAKAGNRWRTKAGSLASMIVDALLMRVVSVGGRLSSNACPRRSGRGFPRWDNSGDSGVRSRRC